MWNKRLLDLKDGGIRPYFHQKKQQKPPQCRRRFSSGPRLLFLFHLHYPLSLSQTWIRGAATGQLRMPPNHWRLPINISQWIGWLFSVPHSKPQSIRGLTIKPWDLPLKNHHFPFWRGNFLEYPLIIKHGLLDNSPIWHDLPIQTSTYGGFPRKLCLINREY